MTDKFINPKTKEEVFRIDEEGKEVVTEKYKDKWDKKNKNLDKPSKEKEYNLEKEKD